MSAAYSRGKLTVEAGKQFIRWRKIDTFSPVRGLTRPALARTRTNAHLCRTHPVIRK